MRLCLYLRAIEKRKVTDMEGKEGEADKRYVETTREPRPYAVSEITRNADKTPA